MNKVTAVLIAAVMLPLLLSACGSPLSDSLNGTSWTLTAMNDAPVLINNPVTIAFTEGKIGGSSGCNTYGGAYSLFGEKITTDKIVMTLMACADTIAMDQESAFLDILQHARTFKIKDGQLLIFSPDGKSLRFSRNP